MSLIRSRFHRHPFTIFSGGGSILAVFHCTQFLIRHDLPSRVTLLIVHIQAEPGAYSRNFSRFPRQRPFIMYYTVKRHRASPEFISHANVYRWRSLSRIRRRRPGSVQDSCSSNGCSLYRCYHGSIFVRLSFPTPIIGTVDIYATRNRTAHGFTNNIISINSVILSSRVSVHSEGATQT